MNRRVEGKSAIVTGHRLALAAALRWPRWIRASRCGCQLADLLLPWLHTQRDAVEVMSFAADTERVAAFERRGLRHRRSSFSLARSDRAGPVRAAAFPDGVDATPYRLGDADEVVHRPIYVDAAIGLRRCSEPLGGAYARMASWQ